MKVVGLLLVLLLIVPFAGAAAMLAKQSVITIKPVPENQTATIVQPIAIMPAEVKISGQQITADALAAGDVAPVAAISAVSQAASRTTALSPQGSGSRSSLDCPEYTPSSIALPARPYDANGTDCQLKGKGEEIETYLQELENIVENCRARAESVYDVVVAQKEILDAQIEQLRIVPPPDLLYVQPVRSMCGRISPAEPLEGSNYAEDRNNHYINWLERIAENTLEYCEMIDEMMVKLVIACNDLNEEIECEMNQGGLPSEAARTTYHARLDSLLNGISAGHDTFENYYANTLQQYGFGNFRQYFRNGTNIDCAPEMIELEIVGSIEEVQPQNQTGFASVVKVFFARLFSWW